MKRAVTPQEKNRSAVVLLSGGIDSATTLAVALSERFQATTLSFDYGQRHRAELLAARKISESLGALRHEEFRIPLERIGGSALTSEIEVPKDRIEKEIGLEIPVTYVPARNTVFLSLALSFAETLESDDIFIGANALDYSGYPDCRPEFLSAFEKTAALGTRRGSQGARLRVHAPLLRMTKAEIITLGASLSVDFGLTLSCYDPDRHGRACGRCDSCLLRKRGFREAGVSDPTIYVTR